MTWSAILLSLFTLPFAFGETKPPQVTLQVPDHVRLGTKPKKVQIDILVAKGFHLQANPVSREGLIPTEIQLEPSPIFNFSSYTYPKGTTFRLAQGSVDIQIYSGNFPVSFELSRQTSDIPPKKHQLVKGQIHYQVCDEHVCLRPASVPFEFWVETPK